MKIEIINPDSQVDAVLFKQTVIQVIEGENKTADYVNVVFMGNDELRTLKHEYFGLDVYTDVIAFNLNEPDEPLEGEIYLSLEQINLNAAHYKTTPGVELIRVLIHGCLHLCGYEDGTSQMKNQMTALEDKYLSQLAMGDS